MDAQVLINKYLSKVIDMDGFYGAQCWDFAKKYAQDLGLDYPNTEYMTELDGYYVGSCYENRFTNGLLNNFTEVYQMQTGDIAHFKISPLTPYTHVAVFLWDIDGVNGAFLGQNQGAPNGAVSIVELPYEYTYLYALRPKNNIPEEDETVDAILTVNSSVTFKRFIAEGIDIQNDWAYSSLIGGYIPCSIITEVSNADGSNDQILHVGSECEIEGVYTVGIISEKYGTCYINELGFWVRGESLNVV